MRNANIKRSAGARLAAGVLTLVLVPRLPALLDEIECRAQDELTETLLRKVDSVVRKSHQAPLSERFGIAFSHLCAERALEAYAHGAKAAQPLLPIFTEAEQKAVLDTVRGDSFSALQERATLIALLGCGLRAREVVALDIHDLRRRGEELDLSVCGAGGYRRVVPVAGRARDYIDLYHEARARLRNAHGTASSSQALFVMADESQARRVRLERLSRECLEQTFIRACRAARIDKSRRHVGFARPSFALGLYEATLDVGLVAKAMDLPTFTLPRLSRLSSTMRIRQGVEKLAVLDRDLDRRCGR